MRWQFPPNMLLDDVRREIRMKLQREGYSYHDAASMARQQSTQYFAELLGGMYRDRDAAETLRAEESKQ